MIQPAVVLWQGQQIVIWVKLKVLLRQKNAADLFSCWHDQLKKSNIREQEAEVWVCRYNNRSTMHGRPSVRCLFEWCCLKPLLLLLLPCKRGCKAARSYTSTGCLNWLTGCSASSQRLPLCPNLHKVCVLSYPTPQLSASIECCSLSLVLMTAAAAHDTGAAVLLGKFCMLWAVLELCLRFRFKQLCVICNLEQYCDLCYIPLADVHHSTLNHGRTPECKN